MIKLRGWELMLVRMLALPILEKLIDMLVEKAESDSEDNWMDVVANSMKIVIEFLKAPETFEET